MPLRRGDGGDDRRTFELVDTAGVDDDLDLLDAPHPVLLAGPRAVPRGTAFPPPPGASAPEASGPGALP
ncbi:hypothetical protein, partial [Cellulosimicrobium cellulans]